MRYVFLAVAAGLASVVWINVSSDGGKMKRELTSSASADYSVMPN